eukprot:5298490-Pleurochrysis_carterae.AAC.1
MHCSSQEAEAAARAAASVEASRAQRRRPSEEVSGCGRCSRYFAARSEPGGTLAFALGGIRIAPPAPAADASSAAPARWGAGSRAASFVRAAAYAGCVGRGEAASGRTDCSLLSEPVLASSGCVLTSEAVAAASFSGFLLSFSSPTSPAGRKYASRHSLMRMFTTDMHRQSQSVATACVRTTVWM